MRQQSFRLQGDVLRLHPIEDQYIILVCYGALLIVSTEQSRSIHEFASRNDKLHPWYEGVESVDVSEDYKAVIRIAVVIAQQVRPKEVEIRPGQDWLDK